MDNMFQNMQSAADAYAKLAEQEKQLADINKSNAELVEKVKNLESGSELEKYKNLCEKQAKMIDDLNSAYKTQSDNFNKVLVKYGLPVDEKPNAIKNEDSEEEVAKKEAEAVLKSIKERQEQMDKGE